jgi:hypothetical protein
MAPACCVAALRAGLVRLCPAAEAAFRLGDGFGLLKSAVCSGEPRLQRKALALARYLLTTDANLATSKPSIAYQLISRYQNSPKH